MAESAEQLRTGSQDLPGYFHQLLEMDLEQAVLIALHELLQMVDQ